MTTPNHPTGRPPTAWHTYLNATDAARDQYLATTYAAHRKYLNGPWPDREHYQEVENAAWKVYYTASRTAWQHYTTNLTCPCCTSDSNDCWCISDCGVPRCQMADPPAPVPGAAIRHVCIATPCPECGYNQDQPSYTPNQEGTELWRSN